MESASSESRNSRNGHGDTSAVALRQRDGSTGDGGVGVHDERSAGFARPEGPRRRPPGPSTHLALIVLGIAAVLMVVGTVASGLAGNSKPVPSSISVPTAKGSPLRAVGARTELSAITDDGLPPSDIVDAVALPQGATAVSGSALDNGVASYDHSLSFTVDASQQHVIEFFRYELPALHWHVLSQGPPSDGAGYQILAQHPGSDGYEWELGATVDDEAFPANSEGTADDSSTGGAASKGTTPFTLRLFEVTDDQ